MSDAGHEFPELRALRPRVDEIMSDTESLPGAAAVGRVVLEAIAAAVVSGPELKEAEVRFLMRAALARLARVEPECAACALVHVMITGEAELKREAMRRRSVRPPPLH